MFWRNALRELEPVRRALAQGRYDAAFDLLQSAAERPRGAQARSLYRLHLAALYALYGDDGVDDGMLALRGAAEIDPGVARLPLYRALFWEFGALRGEAARTVKRGLRSLRQAGDPVALYHAASALLIAGAPRGALSFLEALDEAELPQYLHWRRWSLCGLANERLGRFHLAAEAFARSVALSTGPEQQLERLGWAGCLLELDRPDEALEALQQVDEALLELPEDLVEHLYLQARAETERGNPNRALEHLRAARAAGGADESLGDAAFALLFDEGQVLSTLGRFAEAAQTFAAAAERAAPGQRSTALHECSLALLESGDLEAAQRRLEEVAADLTYHYRAEALADLADVLFKVGAFDQAQRVADEALELGATAPACLSLGAIAYEYYRLDEAVVWFERAASASEVGDPIWILAQQLLADVFAQQGPVAAERLAQHAGAALAYTDPSNEWFLPLKSYLESAQRELGGHRRVLN